MGYKDFPIRLTPGTEAAFAFTLDAVVQSDYYKQVLFLKHGKQGALLPVQEKPGGERSGGIPPKPQEYQTMMAEYFSPLAQDKALDVGKMDAAFKRMMLADPAKPLDSDRSVMLVDWYNRKGREALQKIGNDTFLQKADEAMDALADQAMQAEPGAIRRYLDIQLAVETACPAPLGLESIPPGLGISADTLNPLPEALREIWQYKPAPLEQPEERAKREEMQKAEKQQASLSAIYHHVQEALIERGDTFPAAHKDGHLSREEAQLLFHWLEKPENQKTLFNHVSIANAAGMLREKKLLGERGQHPYTAEAALNLLEGALGLKPSETPSPRESKKAQRFPD